MVGANGVLIGALRRRGREGMAEVGKSAVATNDDALQEGDEPREDKALASDRPVLTEDLLERLLASASPECFLDVEDVHDRELTSYLFEILNAHGLKRATVARESGINPTYVYDIFAGKSNPGRDRAIMLAFGLRCNLRETQQLLRRVGVSELWCKSRRDAIIIWCINRGFDRVSTDDELCRLGERTLLSSDRLR